MAQIYLIGFMGTGKSTVAKALSGLLDCPVVDLDDEIEKTAGMSIADYFQQYGETSFRLLEHQVLKQVSCGQDAIVSCGGGVALRRDNVDCMKAYGRIFLLTASPKTVWERVRYDDKRPLLQGKKNVPAIEALMNERLPFYEKAADKMVSTDERSPREIAEEIADFLRPFTNR